jgi:hypothetical protein
VEGPSFTIEQILTLLADAPQRITVSTAGLSPTQLRTNPSPDEWSGVDLLAHLRSCSDVWGGCMAKIVAEDKPTFRAISPRTWIKRTDYLDLEFQPSFQAFTAQRTALVAFLEALPPAAWSRTATVKAVGRLRERTVHFYAQMLADHELQHLNQYDQIVQAVNK